METGQKTIPALSVCLEKVSTCLAARNRTRRRRHLASLAVAGPREFPTAIALLRSAHQALIERAHQRGAAWVPLEDAELVLLEHQIDVFQGEKQLEVLEDIGVYSEEATQALNLLRVNRVMGQTIIKGDKFRESTRQLVTDAIAHFDSPLPLERDRVVVIPIWRAGLVMAEAYQRMGFSRFGQVGLKRNEARPNKQEAYHIALPQIETCDEIHIVDPMLATGGSILKTLEILEQKKITPRRIVVHVLIAAPEGIDALLVRHPRLRITAHARDGHLNHLAYIEDVGLGDAGDQLMDGVEAAYVHTRWVGAGILSRQEGELALDRMRRVAELGHITGPNALAGLVNQWRVY